MTYLSAHTWREVEASFGEDTIAILPVGSLEPHGPHLPLDTDLRVALASATRAAELLAAVQVQTIILPPLPYGITRSAQDFPGGVTLRPGTLWAFVEDLVLSLQQDGIRQLVLANGHHESEHMRILANLASDYSERGPGCCQLLHPRAGSLDFDERECHGGRRETSLMLAIAPECVRREELAELPAVELDLADAQPLAGQSLLELGASGGYCGDPAAATVEEGRALLEQSAGELVEACRAAWPDLFGTFRGSELPVQ